MTEATASLKSRRIVLMILLAGQQGDTDILFTVGDGEGGMIRDKSPETYVLLDIK